MRKFLFVRIPKTASTAICTALGIDAKHKTAAELKKEVPDFDTRFKFSIVRNPYDRFISICKFFDIRPETHGKGFFFRSQADFLYINGKLAVDYVGRFEDLENSFKHICNEIGTGVSLNPHVKPNDGGRLGLEDVRDIVNKYYRKDFELFGYKLEL